jgi:hypothetical protein
MPGIQRVLQDRDLEKPENLNAEPPMRSDTKIACISLLLCLGTSLPADTGTVQYVFDRQVFEDSLGSGVQTVGFDGIAAGTRAPFSDGGVTIEHGIARDGIEGLPHDYWFPSGSPGNFVDTEAIADLTPEDESGFMPIVLEQDAFALGFLYRCFSCDLAPNESEMLFHFYDRQGNPVAFLSTPFDMTDAEKFLGFRTSFPFAVVKVGARRIDSNGGGNWFIDDLMYVPDRLLSDGFENRQPVR